MSPYHEAVELSKIFELQHPLDIRIADSQFQEGMKFENGRHVLQLFSDTGAEDLYEHFARAKAGELFGRCYETFSFADGTAEEQTLLFFAFVQSILLAVTYRVMRNYLPESVAQREIGFMYEFYVQEIRSESSMELWILAMHVMLADQGKIDRVVPLRLFRFREVAAEALTVLDGKLDETALMQFFNRFSHLHGMQASIANGEVRLRASQA